MQISTVKFSELHLAGTWDAKFWSLPTTDLLKVPFTSIMSMDTAAEIVMAAYSSKCYVSAAIVSKMQKRKPITSYSSEELHQLNAILPYMISKAKAIAAAKAQKLEEELLKLKSVIDIADHTQDILLLQKVIKQERVAFLYVPTSNTWVFRSTHSPIEMCAENAYKDVVATTCLLCPLARSKKCEAVPIVAALDKHNITRLSEIPEKFPEISL